MNYLNRHLEDRLKRYAKAFKIVLVAGARQVGKTTLLKHAFPEIKHVVFDPVQDLYGARNDPDQFLETFGSPLILDEVQFVPELLPALKRQVDRNETKGQYFLTSSQNLAVLRNVSENLAVEWVFFDSTDSRRRNSSHRPMHRAGCKTGSKIPKTSTLHREP